MMVLAICGQTKNEAGSSKLNLYITNTVTKLINAGLVLLLVLRLKVYCLGVTCHIQYEPI